MSNHLYDQQDDDVVVAAGPITVTATVTYEYDPRDGIVLNAQDAEEDVRDMLDSGRLTSGDFTIAVTEGPAFE